MFGGTLGVLVSTEGKLGCWARYTTCVLADTPVGLSLIRPMRPGPPKRGFITQPDGYVAVMPYPACLHRTTSSSLPTQLLKLGARHSDIVAVAAGALIAAALWVFICVLAYQMIGLMC
jgi:hypothetical protein